MRTRLADLWSEPSVRRLAMALPVVLALAVGLLAFVWPHDTASPLLLRDPLTVKRALSTAGSLFGDTITAEVDVFTDDAAIEPGSVVVRTDFRPYRAVETEVERSRQGSVSLLRTVVQLRCLAAACLPRADGRPFEFKPLEIAYRQGGEDRIEQIPWRALAVSSRLSSDARSPLGIVDTPPPLSPELAWSPGIIRAALVGLALLLGLVGSLFVVQGLWPRFPYSLRQWRRLGSLERSLVQVEAAAHIDDEALRRRVLDQLARQLEVGAATELGREARRLAWTATPPASADLLGIVARIQATSGSVAR